MTLLNSLSANALQHLSASSAHSQERCKNDEEIVAHDEKALLQTVQIIPGQHQKQKHQQHNNNKKSLSEQIAAIRVKGIAWRRSKCQQQTRRSLAI